MARLVEENVGTRQDETEDVVLKTVVSVAGVKIEGIANERPMSAIITITVLLNQIRYFTILYMTYAFDKFSVRTIDNIHWQIYRCK